MNAITARLVSSSSGATQSVATFASRSAFSCTSSQALALERPGADEGLVDQVLLVRGRRRRRPAAARSAPTSGAPASRHRPAIRARAPMRARTSPRALGVVRLRGPAGRAGSAPRASRVGGVDLARRSRPARRVAADLVQRQPAACSGRAPCPRRPSPSTGAGRLLEAHATNPRRRRPARSAPAAARAGRPPPPPPVVRRRRRRPGLDVGAVHRQRGDRLGDAAARRPAPAAARPRAGRWCAPRRAWPRAPARANARRSPVSSAYRSVSGPSPAGSMNSAGGVGHELVAGRPLDRPVRQLLAGLEDLLHPHVRDAALASRAR